MTGEPQDRERHEEHEKRQQCQAVAAIEGERAQPRALSRPETAKVHRVNGVLGPNDCVHGHGFKPIIRDDPAEAERVWAAALERAGTHPDAIRNAWLGSPQQIAERLEPYVSLGYDTVIIELPAPYDPETIERLATEVKPMVEARSPR
jgi:alkanesulfonate monooxygenase SsuD/methylene tetrahydromethanopterin reductase-like flavin-dependent oxidoreductase (luciferase family)